MAIGHSLLASLVVVVAIAALGACGASPGGDGPAPSEPGDGPVVRPTPSAFLTITVREGKRGRAGAADRGGGEAREATLSCAAGADRVTGYLRLERAPDVCRRLAGLTTVLTTPPSRDRACAQVYGGPATARVSGRIDGRRVDRRLARTDACEIDDWNRLGALLLNAE